MLQMVTNQSHLWPLSPAERDRSVPVKETSDSPTGVSSRAGEEFFDLVRAGFEQIDHGECLSAGEVELQINRAFGHRVF